MQRAVDTAPEGPRRDSLMTALGAMSLSAGNPREGEQTFKRLLSSRTGAPSAMLGMAGVALARGDLAGARSWVDQAREAGAPETTTARLAARIDIADRQYEAACTRLLAHTDRVPQDLEAWSLLAIAMVKQGRAAAAETEVLPRMLAVTERKHHPLVFQVKGLIAQAKGPAYYPAARDALRSAAAMVPRRRDLRSAILDLDLAIGEDDTVAAADAVELLRVDRDSGLAHFVLGSQAAQRGRLDDAEWHLRASVAGSPTPGAWNNLADVLRQRRALDEAEDAARRAMALSTNSAAYRDTLACVLLEKGNTAEARTVILQARTLDPKDVQVAFTAARVLWIARECREARETLRQVEEHIETLPPPMKPEVKRLARLWDSQLR
jgi:Flp pilus assembly protein TadD